MNGEKLSDLLVIFRHAIDRGSFSSAGRRLNMSPAWVAKQVTRLEASLDATLIIRSTRALRLTEAGQECYRTAGIVSEELSALKEKLHLKTNEMTGTIRVNVPSIIAHDLLAPHLAKFQRLHPKLRLEIVILDSFTDVLNDEVDIVFRVTEVLNDSTAVVAKVGVVERVLCASPTYLKSNDEIHSLEVLEAQKVLMFSGLKSPNRWFLRCGQAEAWVAPRVGIEANNSFILKRAAVDGTGIAYLPKIIIRSELKNGTLTELDAFQDAAPLSLFMLRAPQKNLPNRVRAAWNYFASNLKPMLSDER